MTTQTQQNSPFKPGNQPLNPGSPVGYKDIQMPAVHPDAAKQIIESRPMPKVWQPPAVMSLASNITQGAPSIVEMARALKNDPQLIYQFVYDNIEHAVGFGLAKGSLSTLLDGYGNSFDQCALLAALLRQAGFVANYEVGQIQITLAQATAWLGITDNNIYTANYVLANGGVPVSVVGTFPNEQLLLSHCWLRVNIGTVPAPIWVVMDPSFKTYTTKTAINLATATGYSQATFLTQARTGYTIDGSGNWVQNVNRANLRSQLSTLSMNLANWIKNNNLGATTDDIIGGRQIVPVTLPITFPATLSYQAVGNVPTEFTADFSTAYKVTVQLQFPGINVTLTSDQLSGHRLTFFYTPSGAQWAPVLALDGVTVATGSPQFSNSYNSIQFTVTHNAYPNTFSNQNFYQYVYAPNQGGGTGKEYYLIGSSFGPSGKGSFDYHTALQLQNEFNAGGASETLVNEPALGERMAAQWASFCAQSTRATDIVNRLTATAFYNHHSIGLVKYQVYGSPTFSAFDIGGVAGGGANLNGSNTNYAGAQIANGMHGYALEMLAIQQLTGLDIAVSTTRDLDVANSAGTKIYKGTSANWTGTVVPALSGYNPTDLSNIETYYLPYGWNALLAQTAGQSFAGHWTLTGYSLINTNGGAQGIIYGSYAGGIGPGWWGGKTPPKKKDCEEADPVNIRTGDYLYRHTDLTIGSGQFPYSLPFTTSYDSRARLSNGPLGLGWTHNWAASAKLGSDGFVALGSESPINAVASIVEIYVGLDLLSDTTLPVDKLVMVHLANQWWVDQLTNNVVSVSMPDDEDVVFTLLPDGTYGLPQNNASILTLVSGAYKVTTPQKTVYSFNTSGQLASIAWPTGVTITLTYTAGKLTSISNGMGRTLTLGYTGNFISTVSDGTGRSVSYMIDGSNQMTKFTDAIGGFYTFAYSSPGRMQKYFKPQNPTNACVTNTYDSLNRISSQLDIMGHTITFYMAGSRSEIIDTAGNKSITYFDGLNNPVKEIDALGFATVRIIDGLGRISRVTQPEGNYTSFLYDAKNNILSETDVAKSGSGLANIVRQSTYDPLWNKVKVATDGRGNSTTNTYDAVTGNLLTIQKPVVGGQTPTATMTWNARGQMLTLVDETGIVSKMVYDTVTEKLTSGIADFGISPRLNLTINLGYDAVGNLTSIQDPRGNSITLIVDNLRRVTQKTESAPFSYQTQFVYDGNDNLLTLKRQTGIVLTPWQTYTWTYSLSDKKKTLLDPASNLTTWNYDGADRLQQIIDAENRLYQYAYDVLNRVSTVTDPTSVVSETRGYSANGKLTSIKDARNFTTNFTFDGFDRPDKTTYPDSTFEQNQLYDANGNVLTYRVRTGNTLISTFDVLNRLATKAPQSEPTVTYLYDLANRLLSATTPVIAGDPSSGAFQRQYDSAGRFFKEIYPDLKAVTSVLDANGNVTKITYADGYFVDRVYDQLNRLTTIKLNGAATAAATYGYDQLSRRASLALSSGSSVAYGFQLNDDLTTLTHNFVGSSLVLTDAFNKVHQMTSQNFSDSTYSVHPSPAGTKAYTAANNINEYPQVGAAVYSYNANGCLTGDGTWTHGYDTENHLLTSSKTGTSLAFVYDPFHRQAQKAITSGTAKTRYIYSGWQRIADYNGVSGALQNRYVYGINMDEPLIQVTSAGVLTFLHANHQGSIIAKTSATGTVSNKYKYGLFGETASLSGTTFGFNGQRFDSESSLYYYKRRFYSPAIGRFLQPDPIGYDLKTSENCGCSCTISCGGAEPSQLNLYSYVQNDPLNKIDPLGLQDAAVSSTGSLSQLGAAGLSTILLMSMVNEIVAALTRIKEELRKIKVNNCKNQALAKYERTLEEIEKAYPCPIRDGDKGFQNRRDQKRGEAYQELLADTANCEAGISPGPATTLNDLSY